MTRYEENDITKMLQHRLALTLWLEELLERITP